ncbi:ATP-binding protein [Glaciecola sp. 2405UD65-10]|uniref:sensor histidine kinase n=1 Tax=Glaciecola sp. 2405UD65-10 TaxID=3397244 RepID=UPI003B5B20F4
MRAIKAYSKSSSFVVSFVFTALMMLGVGFNMYTLNVANDELLIRESQAAIQADIGGFRSLYNTAGRTAVVSALKERVDSRTNDFLYYLKSADDTFIGGNLSIWPAQNYELVKNGVIEIEYTPPNANNDSPPKTQSAIAMVVEFENKDTLLVARSVQDIEFAVALAQTSSWVMIVILCTVAAISLAVAYYVVSRINKISETADDIIRTGDLSDRLHVDSSWDDLSKLTLVLNELLDKIEHSVLAIRSVSDNIAHDLRTPLTRLKSHIEVISDEREKAELISECDNLMGIFNSLLRISDIENSAKKAGFQAVQVRDVVDDAVDLYSALFENKDISFTYKAYNIDVFSADKDLLFQAFANVLDNAIKFTPNGGKIAIALKYEAPFAIFSVDDTGVGVSNESIQSLTRRFYREDKSRSTVGNGLGLALVSAIVSLHGGKVWFEPSRIQTNTSKGLRCAFSLQID